MAIAEQKERYFAMTMKKLFAGLAAAATLLSGLALGVSTANAADQTPVLGNTLTLTTTEVKNLQKDANGAVREYKAYKLASIALDAGTNAVTVTTTNDEAANAIKPITGYDPAVDPIVWLGQNDADGTKTAAFATTLASETDKLGTPVTGTVDVAKATVTFGPLDPGVYLIVDDGATWEETVTDPQTNVTTTTTYSGTNPIILSTEIPTGVIPEDIKNATGTIAVKPQVTTTNTYQTKFTKVGVDNDAKGLQGAVFTIYASEEDMNNNHNALGTATSNESGVVTLSNLKADTTYWVKETTIPTGYANYAASFKVTVSKDGTTFTYAGLDQWNLAPKDSSADYKVANVKSITQLPLTGAAGTILFSAVGVLLAAAAGTVFLKSRSTKRALRA